MSGTRHGASRILKKEAEAMRLLAANAEALAELISGPLERDFAKNVDGLDVLISVADISTHTLHIKTLIDSVSTDMFAPDEVPAAQTIDDDEPLVFEEEEEEEVKAVKRPAPTADDGAPACKQTKTE